MSYNYTNKKDMAFPSENTVLRKGLSQNLSIHVPSAAGIPEQGSSVQPWELDHLIDDWTALTRGVWHHEIVLSPLSE